MRIQLKLSSIIFLAWLNCLLRSIDTIAALDTTDSSKDYTNAAQSHRQLQLFRNRAYCVSRGNGEYETVRPFFLFRMFYAGQRTGSCGDICDDLCDHSPCFKDFEVSGNNCKCIKGATYLCRSNTRCTTDDRCVCLDGASGNPVGEGCSEPNECLSDNICKAPAAVSCTNTFGSYFCVCAQGYEWKGLSNGGCVDINECAVNPGICGPSSINSCTNLPGSFSCSCKNGFQGTSPNCIDIDECAGPGSPCRDIEFCVNNPGSYECKCKPGYFKNVAGVCVDVNECLQTNPTVCKPTSEKCFNTEGSYECKCADGYIDIDTSPQALSCDINECLSDNICKAPAAVSCTNTFGSYSCVCAQGYEWKGISNGGCVDINECTVNPEICGPSSSNLCTNQAGSYSCSCKSGFLGTSPNCIDQDECAGPGNPCRDKQVCVNTPGSFQCNCISGYTQNSAGDCVDVNECIATNPVCKPTTEKCFNTESSFECKCADGYIDNDPTDGVLVCVDKDECVTNANVCDSKQVCVNTPGSYKCNCKAGYVNNAAGDCVDVNECLQSNICKPTTEQCFNTEGSFECKCAGGYIDNDLSQTVSCVDINECEANPNICGSNSDCTNIPGSYTCRCKRGYIGQSCTPTECTNNGVICGYDTLCDIALNSTVYSCKCPLGFGGNASDVCFDIDECKQNAIICSTGDQVCVNSIGSYRCAKKDFSSCSNESECLLGSACELKSRSEQTQKVCCAEKGECGAKRCCNGALNLNEPCPSRNSLDCRSGHCARASQQTLQYKCCEDSFKPFLQLEPVCR